MSEEPAGPRDPHGGPDQDPALRREPSRVAFTDLHNHLVPGVDDGPRNLEEAVDGVGAMVDGGAEVLVTTPHFRGSLTLDPAAFARAIAAMDDAWEQISAEVGSRFPELRFQRGHEILLDVPEPDLSDGRLRLGKSTAVLVEWPNFRVPPASSRSLGRIRESGAVPVVAHPERYRGYQEALARPADWREQGALLQVNTASLLGGYGPEARQRAVRLLRQGWVDILATDFHARSDHQPVIEDARALVVGSGGEEQWDLLTRVNPRRILDDQEVLPVPPIELDNGIFARLRRAFGGRS